MAGRGLMLLGGRGSVFRRGSGALLRCGAGGFIARGLRVIRLRPARRRMRRLSAILVRTSRRRMGRFGAVGFCTVRLRAIFSRGAVGLRTVGGLGPARLCAIRLGAIHRSAIFGCGAAGFGMSHRLGAIGLGGFRPVGRSGIAADLFHRARGGRQIANVILRDRPHTGFGSDGMLGDDHRRAAMIDRRELGAVGAGGLAKLYLRPHGRGVGFAKGRQFRGTWSNLDAA